MNAMVSSHIEVAKTFQSQIGQIKTKTGIQQQAPAPVLNLSNALGEYITWAQKFQGTVEQALTSTEETQSASAE